METTKFKLTSEGIEIYGSEQFVSAQIENFKALFQNSYEKLWDRKLETPSQHLTYKNGDEKKKVFIHNPTVPDKKIEDEEVEFEEVKKGFLNHDNVLVIDKDKIQIISDINGTTKSQRMIKIVLLYMWAKLQQGIEAVSFSELREQCQYYDALDPANFSKHMDVNKKFFITLGNGKNKSAKLIRPGIREAEKLILELNQYSK
jgi:hypothetical protein